MFPVFIRDHVRKYLYQPLRPPSILKLFHDLQAHFSIDIRAPRISIPFHYVLHLSESASNPDQQGRLEKGSVQSS